MSVSVIAVFDVGRTNKKVFLFDETYRIQYEKETQLEETKDEDDFECQDVFALAAWVKKSIREITLLTEFNIKAIAISAHGASFVNIDEQGEPVTPLYNYLKPFPIDLQEKFYNTYGHDLPKVTASPALGNLNAALQLYRLKCEQSETFKKICYALHLPQYINYLLTRKAKSDITSIGCHTHLWNFERNEYHDWVVKEKLTDRLAPLLSTNHIDSILLNNNNVAVGIGLHDSSAALIPYLKTFEEPFILISTGTWCISLNPFTSSPLTEDELKKDCLCYLSYDGKPVKASRLFAGHEHEGQVKRIALHFNKEEIFYKSIHYQKKLADKLKEQSTPLNENEFHGGIEPSAFGTRDIRQFHSGDEAYHQLMIDIIAQQVISTELVLKKTNIDRIFVDGGFSKNPVYMNLLAAAFPLLNVYGTTVAQASALGAALTIHHHWNTKAVPDDLIELNAYSAGSLK